MAASINQALDVAWTFLASFSPFPDEPEWVIEIGIGPIGMIAWCSANGESSVNNRAGKLSTGYSAGCEGPEGDNYFLIGPWVL